MKHYDVVIVGAGPAGLRCAEVLGKTDKNILILEKNSVIGPKVCAGGLTRKAMELMDIPDSLFEYKISNSVIRAPGNTHYGTLPEPVVNMIDRHQFGQWQASKLNKPNIEIRTHSKLSKIEDNKLSINGNEECSFTYLVGADGANSFVRKHLKLPVKKKLVTLQYKIPVTGSDRFELALNSDFFNSGYAWIFPHKDFLSVGCAVNPKYFQAQKLKVGFHKWLEQNNLNVAQAKYESFPVNYDYRGYAFGNIFLAGEAAGMASGLTGEGIYQALVSGSEIAKIIIDKNYVSKPMVEILRYNKIQLRILQMFYFAGPFRNSLYNLIIKLFQSKFVNEKIINGFS